MRCSPQQGDVAKWQGSGLQNRDHRFESGRRLLDFQFKTAIKVLVTLHPGRRQLPNGCLKLPTDATLAARLG